jgi:hypothetical protein
VCERAWWVAGDERVVEVVVADDAALSRLDARGRWCGVVVWG